MKGVRLEFEEGMKVYEVCIVMIEKFELRECEYKVMVRI